MDKTEAFLSKYMEELKLQIEFFDKSILRNQTQIKETKKLIKEAKKSIDTVYNLFSASQSNNEIDTEIRTYQEIIDERLKEIEQLQADKQDTIVRFEEVKALCNISNEEVMTYDKFTNKLKYIRKFMDVDVHRAKLELDNLLSKL